MISILGSTAIAAAAVSSLAGLICLLRGRGRGDQRLIDRGHRAVIALFVAVTAAVVALEVALIGVDFSVRYLAANINRAARAGAVSRPPPGNGPAGPVGPPGQRLFLSVADAGPGESLRPPLPRSPG